MVPEKYQVPSAPLRVNLHAVMVDLLRVVEHAMTSRDAATVKDLMTYRELNAFCRKLPATTYVMQWGGSHVWKVGGKVFVIGGGEDDAPSYSFKVSDLAFEILKEQRGLRPAPYLASRGLKWIQHYAKPGLPDEALRDYIRQSHAIVAQGLSKKRRIELGLEKRKA